MCEWVFQFYNTKGSEGWWLNINSQESLDNYFSEKNVIDFDKEHFEKLDKAGSDDRTKITHTEFGHLAKIIMKDYNVNHDFAYNIIKDLQRNSMLKIMNEGNQLLVNRRGGFRIKYKKEKALSFVRRNKLEFPRYFSEDIRIKKFPDGKHWYAYVGDMQVRDGDILKWNSYDEALQIAENFIRKPKIRSSEKDGS